MTDPRDESNADEVAPVGGPGAEESEQTDFTTKVAELFLGPEKIEFTADASALIFGLADQHHNDLANLASVAARRQKSEVVTVPHVRDAAVFLGQRTRRRGLGLATGGVLLGAGLGDAVAKVNADTAASGTALLVTLGLVFVGTALTLWDWFKT